MCISSSLAGGSVEPRIFKGSFEIEILNLSLDLFISHRRKFLVALNLYNVKLYTFQRSLDC